jgi:hypothetical protein
LGRAEDKEEEEEEEEEEERTAQLLAALSQAATSSADADVSTAVNVHTAVSSADADVSNAVNVHTAVEPFTTGGAVHTAVEPFTTAAAARRECVGALASVLGASGLGAAMIDALLCIPRGQSVKRGTHSRCMHERWARLAVSMREAAPAAAAVLARSLLGAAQAGVDRGLELWRRRHRRRGDLELERVGHAAIAEHRAALGSHDP